MVLLVNANVPSSPILVTLMMEAIFTPKRWFLQGPHDVTSQKVLKRVVFIIRLMAKGARPPTVVRSHRAIGTSRASLQRCSPESNL
jgi:hypothetical protein